MSDVIQREIGSKATFTNGKDYIPPHVRIVPSMAEGTSDEEKALFIMQEKGKSISISLPTLEAIVAWAKSNELSKAE